jgi:Ca2+-binding RTX toxin-like protein
VRDANGNVLHTGQNLPIDFNPGIPLDDHIITGDGRANENVGLTAVHHVFHEEHNGLVANIQQTIITEYNAILNDTGPNGGAVAAAAFLDPWQINGDWNGERLYQAARLITESEYNHIAIDQFVGTLYGALPEFVSYSSDINMGVSLVFSQAIYRLGHSMLTETFNVQVANDPNDPNAGTHDLTLVEAFLDPTLYQQLGPEALALGLTTTLGNEIDDFVTPALQQMLVGQPLDLATINLARGNDVGLPTWNEFRQTVYDGLIQNTNNTNGSALAPYTNWADVGVHLRNEGTLVNLIAAYARDDGTADWGIDEARDDCLAGAITIDELRVRAQRVVEAASADYASLTDPDTGVAYTQTDHAAAVQFMKGTPTYAGGEWAFPGADQGFWDIDLWIGGLAERPLFDGTLGTTFSYVILDFAQRMQDGDRFYYLYRTPGSTHLGDEFIRNQFGNLVMDNTGLELANGEVFIWASGTFELDGNVLTNVDADSNINDYFNAAEHTITDVDGLPMNAADGHLVVAGNEGDDFILGGLGDDSLYGDAGNDQLYGSQGNDHLFGGAGNDENDDFITGGDGDDVIAAGDGDDVVDAGAGDDVINSGAGDDAVAAGDGNDTIDVGSGSDVIDAGDGADTIDAGSGSDTIDAGSGDDMVAAGAGDDVIEAGDGDDTIDAGGGGDAIVAAVGDGNDALDGGEGRDTLDMSAIGADAVIDLGGGTASSADTGHDTLTGIENAIGGSGNDTLIASDDVNDLFGGAGEDVFVFTSSLAAGSGEGSRDRIIDFDVGDRIDIEDISREFADRFEDALADEGIRRFVLLRDGEAFSEPGQIRIQYQDLDDGRSITVIEGNIDGDADTEFEIELVGHHTLEQDQFFYHSSTA